MKKALKKVLIVLGGIIGFAVGVWLLWEIVFPFLGFVLGKLFSLFPNVVDMVKNLPIFS